MKLYKSYIIGAAAALALCGCDQDDFGTIDVQAPVATERANMTILELKTQYWNDATNYIDTIGIENGVDDGKDYIIAGRVVSSDEAGNVFKSLIIQDETAALALSINSYNLYLKYRVGQEIVINLKGMYIGKYNGLVQLGMPEWYEAGSAWEATFMAPEFFQEHIELNGFPDAAKIDTLEVNSFSDLPSNPEGLIKWQSQLVKFNNVHFENGGKEQFSEYHSSGVNQALIDAEGNSLNLRTSGYSNFWNNVLPEGNGDVVCILSYYGTQGWQLMLNDLEGCMNFGNPTLSPGAESNPYTVDEAIAQIQAGKSRQGWVEGYIVGAVAPEVTSVKANGDVEWSADVVMNNTLVIGATADTKDIQNSLVISLPQGSMLRQYGNLADNPANYKQKIKVRGSFGTYMDTYGILDNKGTASEFVIDGVTIETGDGDGTEAKPYTVEQVIKKNPTGNADNPDEKDVWVKGYIVGWADMSSVFYINAETAQFNANATLQTNILLAITPDVTNYAECIGIQLPSGAVRTALNLQSNPGNLGKEVEIKGNIAKYSGVPGLRSASQYKFLDGSTPDVPVTPGEGKGSGTATDPYNVIKAIEVAKANGQESSVMVYTEGYVASGSIDVNYGNATWELSDNADGSGTTIKAFRVKYFNNEKFTDANAVKVGDKVVIYAPLVNYMGNTPETGNGGYLYSLNGKTEGGQGGGDDPVTPVTGNSADFNTLNGGVSNTMAYGTYKTAQGWTADWSLVLAGGTDATNFVSADSKFLFPCLNGTPARPGKLTSPVLAGGLKKLTFKYGFPYNETHVKFTVNILQGGQVVASDTVDVTSPTKATPFEYAHDFAITGDFTIEIVNDLATQSTSNNKDRLAIWDLSWEN
ncbi:MAG: hypothetical protein K2N16_00030 [Muribaculaceae bacterium]|nr:hypothetical protein [Muribaculaceae bacterium]